MSKPVLYNVRPFDAGNNYIFKFSYTGNQAVANNLLIKNNATGAVVYNKTISAMNTEHEVVGGTLSNGTTYTAQIRTIDSNSEATDYSNPIVFQCLTTPSFVFSNLISNQTVRDSSIDLQMKYSQAEGEELNTYYIVLRDANKQTVHQSPVIYNVTDSYRLDGLTNNQSYYVQAYGETVSGMSFNTAEVQFKVEYIFPTSFSVLGVENNTLAGSLSATSYVVIITGKYDGTPVYINGDEIDLTNGKPVVYNEGFETGANFTFQMMAGNFIAGKPIAELDNGNIRLTVYSCKKGLENEGKKYVQLKVNCADLYTYVLDSEYFSTEKILINLKRVNNNYSLHILEVVE